MTQRDWQKDMEMMKGTFEFDWTNNQDLQIEMGEALPYWLQEAKEQKERADRVTEERQRFNQVYEMLLKKFHAAERREQRLKEAYDKVVEYIPWHARKAYGFDDVLSTLYPDTPAPKEGEPDASLD